MTMETQYIGSHPCIYGCGKDSTHYTIFVCDERVRTSKCAGRVVPVRSAAATYLWMLAFGPKVSVEIVMQGQTVRRARELHAMRKRKPLMGDERRGHGAGEVDLGEIS